MNDGSRVLILRYLIAKSFRLVGLKPVVPEIYLPYQMALARERHGGRKKIVLYADHVEITETIPDGMPEREVTLTYLDSFELVRVLIGDSVGRNASWTAYAWMAKPPLHAWKLVQQLNALLNEQPSMRLVANSLVAGHATQRMYARLDRFFHGWLGRNLDSLVFPGKAEQAGNPLDALIGKWKSAGSTHYSFFEDRYDAVDDRYVLNGEAERHLRSRRFRVISAKPGRLRISVGGGRLPQLVQRIYLNRDGRTAHLIDSGYTSVLYRQEPEAAAESAA